MNQQSLGRKTGPDTAASAAVSAGSGPSAGKSQNANQAVLGPFTVRDLTVFSATVILLVASLLPMFGGEYNLWNLNNLFFLGLGILLPVVVSALFAARRLAPATRIRIGSLSIDQFASVVASFAVAFFFLSAAGAYAHSLLVGLIGSLVLFAATVLGRFLPYVSGDFQGREESPAHVVARDAVIPVQKPRAPKQPDPRADSAAKPSGSGPFSGGGLFSGAGAGSSAVKSSERPEPAERRESEHREPAEQRESTAHHGAAAAAGAGAAGGAAAAATPAAGAAPAAAAPVSTAPEASDWSAAGDAYPATQAADVVRPADASAAEETQHGDIPAAGAGAAAASGRAAAEHHDGGAQRAASSPQSTWEPPAATAVHQQVRADQPIGATVDPASRPDESDEQPVHEAFWFAVAQHRTAFDPRTGAPAFVIEPGGWVLALEDRGHEFLVQHTDGRLGVLRDLSNIERG